VQIIIKEFFGIVNCEGMQYFFLSDIDKGIFGSGKGEEFSGVYKDKGSYEPMWIKIDELSMM
jgi:8-oxo-dGTP diphosphatase